MNTANMTNSEFLEHHRKNDLDLEVMGFYFKNPIPNFFPLFIDDDGKEVPHKYPFIKKCCFYCADYYYFERSYEEEKANFCYEPSPSIRYTVNGETFTKTKTPEEIEEIKRSDILAFERNSRYHLATFPKDLLNTGSLILLTKANIRRFNNEFECDVCDSVDGYL